MPLTQLRHSDEINISVEPRELEIIIAHRLSLTTANHFSDDVDSLEIRLLLPVTIDGTQFQCRDIELYTNDRLRPEILIGGVDVQVDRWRSFRIIFGLQKSWPHEHEDWRVSPLIVKAEDEGDELTDDTWESFIQKKLSERLALLGL